MYEVYDGKGQYWMKGSFQDCKDYAELRIKKMETCAVLTIWKDTRCVAVVVDDGDGIHTEVVEPSHNGSVMKHHVCKRPKYLEYRIRRFKFLNWLKVQTELYV